MHDINFVNVFDSFIPVIMLDTLRVESSVLFGIHTLLDKSFRVLQIPVHMSNLTKMDMMMMMNCFSGMIDQRKA